MTLNDLGNTQRKLGLGADWKVLDGGFKVRLVTKLTSGQQLELDFHRTSAVDRKSAKVSDCAKFDEIRVAGKKADQKLGGKWLDMIDSDFDAK